MAYLHINQHMLDTIINALGQRPYAEVSGVIREIEIQLSDEGQENIRKSIETPNKE